jgi:AGZA family xanthine/uracil permease-like MFS transporter
MSTDTTNGSADGPFARFFGFDEHGTDFATEVIAGAATFLTMSYIIVVNPAILTAAITDAKLGTPEGRAFQLLAIVTILAGIVAMLVMALYANRPFGLAPGLGLNGFFVFVVVGLGIPWQTALAAVFVEGIVFLLLTIVGARKYIIQVFPAPVKFSVGAGIGLFLGLIGLRGMNVIATSTSSGVELSPVLAQDPIAVIGIAGVLATFVLYARGVRGAVVVGLFLTGLGAYVASALGVQPYTAGLDEGTALNAVPVLAPGLDGITYSVAAYDITPLAGAFLAGFADIEAFTFAIVVFTFFFVDFFDTAGTLTGLGQAAGFLDEAGDLPDIEKPLMADAVGTTVGAALGTSTVTAFIESSAGIEEGGRTGMTALVVAVLFFVSLLVVPVLSAIPPFASNVALIVVAVFMFRGVSDVDWGDVTESVPAALTVALMPLTGSIATGIAAGLVSYPIVKAANGEWRDVHPGQWVLAGAFVLYYFVRTNTLA